jgi:hypothetical protein
MQGHIFNPDDMGAVQTLKPESSGEIKLTPDTMVLCINRGREEYRDMFDSRPYVIGPGYFTAPYGAAKHFQARAVVPGSRNPETNFQASFITIIGVTEMTREGLKVIKAIDPADDWPAFSDEECRLYGHAVEALDRANMLEAIEPEIEVKTVAGAGNRGVAPASRVRGGGASNARKRTQIEGSAEAKELLAQKGRAGTNDAINTIRQDQAARGASSERDE